MNEPSVSIVIAVKDGEKTIGQCLESVLAVDYPRFEVIVVDDASGDKTPGILKRYSPRIRLIANAVCTGPSQARNSACAVAQGEYVAFTDGDCIVDKNWLTELVRGFREGTIAGVGGDQKVPDDETAFGRKVSLFMQKFSGVTEYTHKAGESGRYVEHNPSCTSMYKKDVFLREGGFEPHLWPGEDVELDYRLTQKGHKLYFNPRAIVYHYRPGTPGRFARMMYRYGMVQAWLVRRYGLFRKIQVLPLAVIATAALGLVCAFNGLMVLYSLIVSGAIVLAAAIFRIGFDMIGLFAMALFYWNLGFFRGLLFSVNPIQDRSS